MTSGGEGKGPKITWGDVEEKRSVPKRGEKMEGFGDGREELVGTEELGKRIGRDSMAEESLESAVWKIVFLPQNKNETSRARMWRKCSYILRDSASSGHTSTCPRIYESTNPDPLRRPYEAPFWSGHLCRVPSSPGRDYISPACRSNTNHISNNTCSPVRQSTSKTSLLDIL